MSNTQVGNVYQQIIADVVESSRVDFEEGGVDEQVLDELRKGWQQKLSQLKVAMFPWDPKPEPQQQIANPPTVPSNAGQYQQPMSAPPPPQQMYAPPQMGNPRIKPEPGLDSPTSGIPQQAPYQPPILPPQATTAQQRAAMNLQASYGPRAAASINAIQGNMSQQQQTQPNIQHMQQQQAAYQQQMQAQMQQQQRAAAATGGQPQRPPQTQMTQEQYRHAMAQQAQMQQQRLEAQRSVNGAQTDGAGDEMEESVSVIKRMNANGEEVMGRIEIDGLIRDKIASMGQSMEGGGLMLPLHEASKSSKRQRKVKKTTTGLGQNDGGSDDEDEKNLKEEDLDEDAINSDLDDPDDALNGDEDDDEGMGHIMLCMYDKVQRVKNKWKCVMKDGVLTVNGKEYVFHKASGEYEW